MDVTIITGNLTRDPEKGTTPSGINYARFSVAVRKRYHKDGEPDTKYFRVTAWRGLGDSCAKYLSKGKKVAVTGSIDLSCYMGNDGNPRGQLELTADEVEFLSPKGQQAGSGQGGDGFTAVDDDDVPEEWR